MKRNDEICSYYANSRIKIKEKDPIIAPLSLKKESNDNVISSKSSPRVNFTEEDDLINSRSSSRKVV